MEHTEHDKGLEYNLPLVAAKNRLIDATCTSIHAKRRLIGLIFEGVAPSCQHLPITHSYQTLPRNMLKQITWQWQRRWNAPAAPLLRRLVRQLRCASTVAADGRGTSFEWLDLD